MYMKFVEKGLSGIFVTSQEDVQLIHDFWKKHDEFEYRYLNHETIVVVTPEQLNNSRELLNSCTYNCKFEGDIPVLFEYFNSLNKKIKIITGYNDNGFINVDDIFTNYVGDEYLAKKVADLIAEHCYIRGIELEDYKRNLTSESLVKALKLLFDQEK